MRILTLILCAIVIITTGLPLINSAAWWIRIFDFPRIQIAVLSLLAIILAYFFVDFKWEFKLPLMIILAISLVYQAQFVVVYSPLYKAHAKESSNPTAENSFTLLVSNIRMENDEKERFHSLVKKYNPDILLVTEPDQAWAESISKLDGDFPYSITYPLDNHYGIMLMSKLPLTDSAVNFLVKDGILKMGDFGDITLPRLLKVNDWVVVMPAAVIIILILVWIEIAGF